MTVRTLSILTLGLTLMTGCAVAQPYPPIPPPPYQEMRPVAPPGHWSWQPGHWHWNGERYSWIGGHWTDFRGDGSRFVAGHWDNRGGRPVWIPGNWQ
jgi:hypothetical protein